MCVCLCVLLCVSVHVREPQLLGWRNAWDGVVRFGFKSYTVLSPGSSFGQSFHHTMALESIPSVLESAKTADDLPNDTWESWCHMVDIQRPDMAEEFLQTLASH